MSDPDDINDGELSPEQQINADFELAAEDIKAAMANLYKYKLLPVQEKNILIVDTVIVILQMCASLTYSSEGMVRLSALIFAQETRISPELTEIVLTSFAAHNFVNYEGGNTVTVPLRDMVFDVTKEQIQRLRYVVNFTG